MIYTIELLANPDPRDPPGVLQVANMDSTLELAIGRAKDVFRAYNLTNGVRAVRVLENGGSEVFRWLGDEGD